MSTDMIDFDAQVPAHLQGKIGDTSINEDLGANVQAGFGVVSFRGKVWRVKKGGEERAFQTAEGDAISSVEVVILAANPNLSKIFYDKGYEEGSSEAPDCWSVDGVRPDSGAPKPQAASCAACPNNVWGSKVTPSGNKTKACSDARRIAIAFAGDIEKNGADCQPMLMRVPPASLTAIKQYTDLLTARGYPYCYIVTKLYFDMDQSYPKILFKPVRPVNEIAGNCVDEIRQGTLVTQILGSADEIHKELEEVTDKVVTPMPTKAPDPEPQPVAVVEAAPAPSPSIPAVTASPEPSPESPLPDPVVVPEPTGSSEVDDDLSSLLDDVLQS